MRNRVYINFQSVLRPIIVLALFTISINPCNSQRTVHAAIEQANSMIWNQFVDEYGIVRDFVGETPTPKDCLEGRPNALGWWSPIENGPFFTGLYLHAACERARQSRSEADKNKARRLAAGLLKCASTSEVPGFIIRGVGSDGKCHYPLGSADQTVPWYIGLYTYAKSGIPSLSEKQVVINKLKEVSNILLEKQWKLPCDGIFKGEFRGDLKEKNYLEVTCYLFVLRMMYEFTHDEVWLDRYKTGLFEHPDHSDKNRAEICAFGYRIDSALVKNTDKSLWIYVKNQITLAYIHSMETDPGIKKYFETGLARNARNALSVVGEYETFDNSDTKVFGHKNWRKGYPNWIPQKTQQEAENLANQGDYRVLGERKAYERSYMTNPLAAAVIIALGGESIVSQNRLKLENVISHYDYSKMHLSEFFFAEVAFYMLPIN